MFAADTFIKNITAASAGVAACAIITKKTTG